MAELKWIAEALPEVPGGSSHFTTAVFETIELVDAALVVVHTGPGPWSCHGSIWRRGSRCGRGSNS
jgi:hypothetical protein